MAPLKRRLLVIGYPLSVIGYWLLVISYQSKLAPI
jgi:hypothetical protein